MGTLAALYGVIEASSLAALPGETAVFVGVVGMLAAVVALEPWIARLRPASRICPQFSRIQLSGGRRCLR